MTRTTIKQTLIDHGVTEVSGALLDALSAPTASGNGVLREAEAWLRECSSWLLRTNLDMKCPMDTDPLDIADKLAALSTTPTMSAEDMREAAASRLCPECEGEGVAEMIGGWPRPCDACHGTGSLPLTKEPTP